MRALVAAAVLVLAPVVLSAHTLSSQSQGGGEAVLIGLLATLGLMFIVGFTRVWRASTVGTKALAAQGTLFMASWLIMAGSLLSPLHQLGTRSFAAHMIEHELLMLVVAPLMIFSRPLGILLWALPRICRHSLANASNGRGWRAVWKFLSSPMIASLLQAAMLWLWHAPALFNRALQSEAWHAAQHLSLVLSSLLFWWSMHRIATLRKQEVVAVFFLFFTSMQSGLLGALMAFANSPWYAVYAAMSMSGTAKLTPLEDQQLAGLIMWVPGGGVHAIAAFVYLGRWFRRTRHVNPSVPVDRLTESLP